MKKLPDNFYRVRYFNGSTYPVFKDFLIKEFNLNEGSTLSYVIAPTSGTDIEPLRREAMELRLSSEGDWDALWMDWKRRKPLFALYLFNRVNLFHNRYEPIYDIVTAKHTLVGAGANGQVFQMRDTYDNVMVAVKTLLGKHDNEAALDELNYKALAEARKLLKLNHENVVRCHDAFIDAEQGVVIVMEFCNEFSLTKLLSKPNLGHALTSLKGRIDAMKQIATGLSYLHDNRVGHRDLKPGNILVHSTPLLDGSTSYRFKISDLGDAGRAGSYVQSLHGTVLYLAPEVYAPKVYTEDGLYDPAFADIFSLGLVFIALLRLEELLGSHWGTSTDPTRTFFPALVIIKSPTLFFSFVRQLIVKKAPVPLDALLIQMLASEPKDRATAAQVVQRLTEIAAIQSPELFLT